MDNGNLERDILIIRIERSNRNIAKAKPSIKSRKNKLKDNTIISCSKSRNRANLRREKEKEREIIEIVIDE
jgi:hypothetical protein